MPSIVGASAHLRHGAPWVLALALAACAAPAPLAPHAAAPAAAPQAVGPQAQVQVQWPPAGWPQGRYALQGVGFAEADVRHVRLEVFHADGAGGVVADGFATADVVATLPTARLNLTVPAGPNRWATLTGTDAAGHPLANLMAAASLEDGTSYALPFDGVSHATGRAISAWRPSGLPGATDQVARVKAFVQAATGYAAGPNTFTGPNPYAFRAEALGQAAAGNSAFLDAPATPAFLTEGWGRLVVQATAQGQLLEPGSFNVTLFDPISMAEALAPTGSSFDRVPPGLWAYRLQSLTGTVWGTVSVGEGRDHVLPVAVDNPSFGLLPQAGPAFAGFERPVLASSLWAASPTYPFARGILVGEDMGASFAFAQRYHAESGQLIPSGDAVALPALAARSPGAVWVASLANEATILTRNGVGKLSYFKSTPANLDAGTVAFLAELPATTPVAEGPGQVAVARGDNTMFYAYRSGNDAILAQAGSNPVQVRLPFPARSLSLTVIQDKPWVAAEVEATGGQSLLFSASVDPANGSLSLPRLIGGGADDLRQPALAEVGATGMALAYEKHLGTATQVAYLYRDISGPVGPEAFVPLSPAFDQISPKLVSAGPGTPPWVAFSERPAGIGGAVRLRVGQLGATSMVVAEEGLPDLPTMTQVLPVDGASLLNANAWAFAHQLPGLPPAIRPLQRALPFFIALPAMPI